MAPKLIRSLLLLSSSVLIGLAALPVARAYADGTVLPGSDLPGLIAFAGGVYNGRSELRGVYVPNVLADDVVQQPTSDATFVSTTPEVVTQFRAASGVGSTGLLAHNYLAGTQFPLMRPGQTVYLVYGNGRTERYSVTQILKYQALQPESPYSNFVDLRDGRSMSATDLFNAAYGRPGDVVFQTCIAANGDPSWGRLFIVAEPYSPVVGRLR